MVRQYTLAALVLGLLVAVLAGVAGCSHVSPRPSPSPAPAGTSQPVASPTAAPATVAAPIRVVAEAAAAPGAGRLPAVTARLSFELAGGQAYGVLGAAFDEEGQAVVSCYQTGGPGPAVAALITIDPQHGTRGPALRLPGPAWGTLATSGGRAYVDYLDVGPREHLIAVDLESGQVVAEAAGELYTYAQGLAVDPAGYLYAVRDRWLDVRDRTTLQIVKSVPCGGEPGVWSLALDAAHGRVYVASERTVQAYRLTDLQRLWESSGDLLSIRRLVADRSGRRVYACREIYSPGPTVAYLLPFDAETGAPLPPVSAPEGHAWQLIRADAEAGQLLLSEQLEPEPRLLQTRIWQAGLDGRPLGPEITLSGRLDVLADADGSRALALAPGEDAVSILDAAGLQPVDRVTTGIAIRNLLPDAASARLYLNDTAGTLYVLDAGSYRLLATIPAGSGPLALDAANRLLFVAREPYEREVAVVDTAALTVTATITGGYSVALDPAGHRAFVGWTGPLWAPSGPGQVQVWDTRTFRRLGAIAHRGKPTYNPLRDEVYLADDWAYAADGQSLVLTGELLPRPNPAPGDPWLQAVTSIEVDSDLDVIAIGLSRRQPTERVAFQQVPEAALLSARTREPMTHTATVLPPLEPGGEPIMLAPEGGRVYVRASQGIEGNNPYGEDYGCALAYRPGSAAPSDYRENLGLDCYLPGTGVGLSLRRPYVLAVNAGTWEPLGWIPYEPIRAIDTAGRRLYAWEGAQLTVLSFEGGTPLPPAPPRPRPEPAPDDCITAIRVSPAYARDRTVFALSWQGILRSTDGGATWTLLGGIFPEGAHDPAAMPRELAISPAYERDRTLFIIGGFLGGSSLGIWKSSDGGDTWAPASQGLSHLGVSRLAFSPRYAEDRTVVAYSWHDPFWENRSAEAGPSAFASQDGGVSWHELAGTAEADDLACPPAGCVVFAIPGRGGLVSRLPGAGRGEEVVLRPPEGVFPMAPAPSPGWAQDGQVYLLAGDRLCRSADGGRTWQAAGNPYTRDSGNGGRFTALAVGLDADGQPLVFLGDSNGRIEALEPGAIPWVPVP